MAGAFLSVPSAAPADLNEAVRNTLVVANNEIKYVAERVFEPFFTTKDVGVGTGQGLTLAYSLVRDRHHGTITFQSQPGAGTTFTVRLPVLAPADDKAA